MNNYKIKFKNGRTTTICCDSNEELKSDLVDLTKRFNSEIATINDMPTEKLSVGGFLLGTFLGGILGNSVAKSGVKKTAKTISKKAKTTISKTRKGVSEFRSASSKSKKYSGGGGVSKETNIKAFFKNFGFNVEDIQPDEYGNGIEGWIVFYDNKNKYRVIDYSTAKYLMVHDKTTNKTDIIKQSKLFNIDEYSKGGGTKQKQKINKKYTHFAVSKEDGKIADAWETLDDIETLKHYANLDLKTNDHNPKDFNILSAKTLIKRGINPYDSDNWGHFSTRATRYETGGGVQNEYSFQGNTMINGLYQPVYKKDGKYYLKYFNPTRYSFLANESDIKNYRLISMYEDGGMSSMALAGASPQLAIGNEISKRLPATTSAIDKKFAERIYSDRPSMWEDRGLQHYADGGAIQNQYENRTPDDVWNNFTTNQKVHFLMDHFVAEEDEPQPEYKYLNDDDLNFVDFYKDKDWKKLSGEVRTAFKDHTKNGQYAKGGTIGQQITFKHWSGDTKNGTITEDLGEGNFQVSSGFGNVLVNQEDIISTSTKSPERKKMFGFFKGGGGIKTKNDVNLSNFDSEKWGKGKDSINVFFDKKGRIRYVFDLKDNFLKKFSLDGGKTNYSYDGKGYNPEYSGGGSTTKKPYTFTNDPIFTKGKISIQRVGGSTMWNVAINQKPMGRILDAYTKEQAFKKVEKEKFAGGGSTNEGIDLFEDYENIPPEVQAILDKYSQGIEDGDYNDLGDAKNELEEIGYTFDYYLDGVAYDLRPIGSKGKVEE